ncbi:hypothetical protein N8I77_012677 [Diaporthe amygdali]|uniref:Major facilitator superfamily (MFS) profile domain-containing protein n=1 Tax=Phomopsis amygdali TaxID=1214568 RepID=A0AAD9S422_PHOAM|nr:hypothetical protein N8I77_012677 [Diaporthe amygdali]
MAAMKDSSEAQLQDETIEKYSVFSSTQKWCITALVAYAAWFSTLSSFIYFPALHQLADYFSVSPGKINLTITSYMAVATVAPMLIGDAADILGRRPIYVFVLGMYVAANIAIASSKSYASLLGLRVLQALAISGTFSVAYGVITDIASPAERGSFVSAVSFAITIAPSIGPVLGGGIAYSAGWTWIFWFLAVASGVCLVLMIFLLPETSRNVVGNGSTKPSGYLVFPVLRPMRPWKTSDAPVNRLIRVPNPFKSLIILLRKDNATIILACGLLYVVYTCINASLSTLFIEIYQLNQWQAGLIYLPFGLGGTVSTFISGPLLDQAYRNARAKRGLPTDRAMADDLDNFPVEKARLSAIWAPLALTICSIMAFGWVLEFRRNLAIPLCLQFLVGLCMQLDFSIYNTLLVDKNHKSPAAAQASSNIVRCTLAAITIAFLQDLISSIGIGWTYTLMGGLCIGSMGLFFLDYHLGFTWRQRSSGAGERHIN